MNYLLITPIYLPHMGGIEMYVHDLAQHLVLKNNKVVIFAADQDTNHISKIEENGVLVYKVPVKSYAGVLYLRNNESQSLLFSLLKYCDIVHANDCKFLYNLLGKKKSKYGYKLYLSSHGFIFHTKKNLLFKKLFFRWTVVRNQKYYDKIICVSQQDSEIAMKYHLKNIEVVFPGVNIEKYSCLPSTGNYDYSFVYYGRIAPNKGIKECLYKLCELDDFSFNLIGKCDDEEYMNDLKLLLNEKGKSECVNFLGSKTEEEIRGYLSEANYIVFPSLHEGFGMTLTECLNSDKILIANKNTSFTRILEEVNATEYLFDFENKLTSIAAKINDLVVKKIKPENIEQFSLNAMFEKLDSIYADKEVI